MTSEAVEQDAEIRLYADGSYSQEARLGAWAYYSPLLSLRNTGGGHGMTVVRFEFLGLVCGLEEIAATDASARAIEVITDCTASKAVINCLAAGEPLPEAKRYKDILDLIPRLQTVMSGRRIRASAVGKDCSEHRDCHRRAGERLRYEIKNISRFYMPLLKQSSRLENLKAERAGVLRRLSKLQEDIAMAEAEVEALEAALERDGGFNFAPAIVSAKNAQDATDDAAITLSFDQPNGHA